MSRAFDAPANAEGRTRSSGNTFVALVKALWLAYLARRVERAAIMQLRAMSERELRDIGLTRSQIEPAVRGELDQGLFTSHF